MSCNRCRRSNDVLPSSASSLVRSPAKKRVLILGASRYYSASIAAAKRAGYEVVAVDRTSNSPGFEIADASAVIDIVDVDGIARFAREQRIDGIVPLNDYGVPTAAAVAERLGLPGISSAVAERATRKSSMRDCWMAAGVPCPRVELALTAAEIPAAAERVGYPCILKPAHGIGGASRGVVVVNSHDELADAIAFATSFYADHATLVESFIDARMEHSAEVLIIDGEPEVLVVADKIKSPLPYRVDQSVLYPTALSGADYDRVIATVCDAVRAIGIPLGAAHVELATTANGCVLFELGARPGGGGTPEPIVRWVTGRDYLADVVRCYVGDSPAPSEQRALRGATYHFLTPAPGVLDRVEGLDDVRARADVLDADVLVTPGSTIAPVRVGTDRAGFVITGAATRDKAYAAALDAESMIRFALR